MIGENFSDTIEAYDIHDLIEHPEYLNAFFSRGPVIFSIFDHIKNRFSYISPNVKDIVGISPEEIIAMNYREFLNQFMHPDDMQLITCKLLPDIFDYIKKHLKKNVTKISVHYNYRIKTIAGYWMKIEQQITPLEVDDNGKLILDQSIYTQIGKAEFKEKLALKLQIYKKDINGLFNLQFCRTYMSNKTQINSLTPREIQVIRMLTKGLTSQEMADALNICETTVITHRRNMLRKFCLKNTNELISWGYEKGIL